MYDPKEVHLLDPQRDSKPHRADLDPSDVLASHLSDEHFTELLLGSIPAHVSAHLAVCAKCAEEAQRVSGAIGSFEQQTRLWAERRASKRPALIPTRRPALSWLNRPAAWSALAASVVLAAVVGATHQNPRAVSTQQPSQPSIATADDSVEVPSATLKQDNELLSAIHGELSAEATPPANLYGLEVDVRVPNSHSLKRLSN